MYVGEVDAVNIFGSDVKIKNGHSQYKCWRCGKKQDITKHHILNKAWKPKNNLMIPLCKQCHQLIHEYLPQKFRHKKKGLKNNIKITNKQKLDIVYSIREDKPDGSFRVYSYYKFPKDMKKIMQQEKKNDGSHWIRFK